MPRLLTYPLIALATGAALATYAASPLAYCWLIALTACVAVGTGLGVALALEADAILSDLDALADLTKP